MRNFTYTHVKHQIGRTNEKDKIRNNDRHDISKNPSRSERNVYLMTIYLTNRRKYEKLTKKKIFINSDYSNVDKLKIVHFSFFPMKNAQMKRKFEQIFIRKKKAIQKSE
jgi:hypothetical protein